jgi:hypothetical protein
MLLPVELQVRVLSCRRSPLALFLATAVLLMLVTLSKRGAVNRAVSLNFLSEISAIRSCVTVLL